jgi:hypothetical protein
MKLLKLLLKLFGHFFEQVVLLFLQLLWQILRPIVRWIIIIVMLNFWRHYG